MLDDYRRMRDARRQSAQARARLRENTAKESSVGWRAALRPQITPPEFSDVYRLETEAEERSVAANVERWMRRWWPDARDRPIPAVVITHTIPTVGP